MRKINSENLEKFALVISFFMGICGLIGSVIALVPGLAESMTLTPDVLKYAPFKTFLLPGLFLLVFIGGGNLITGILFLTKKSVASFVLLFEGILVMLWIIIQCLLIWALEPMHLIFFLLGLLQFVLACYLITVKKITLPFAAKQN